MLLLSHPLGVGSKTLGEQLQKKERKFSSRATITVWWFEPAPTRGGRRSGDGSRWGGCVDYVCPRLEDVSAWVDVEMCA